MEGFFSRKGITRLQPMLAEVALHLESRFRELEGTNSVIRLDHAFSAFSGDIIGRICLGTDDRGSHGDRFLDSQDFASDWYSFTTIPRETSANYAAVSGTMSSTQLCDPSRCLQGFLRLFSTFYVLGQ